MLIRFKVENLLSFESKVEFSMVAGKVQKHGDQVIVGENGQGINLLKLGLVYGANASGKSNLIKAIDFGRFMVTQGVKAKLPIPRRSFKLNPEKGEELSLIEYEFYNRGKTFAYGFLFDNKQIKEEWLVEIRATTEKKLFWRITNEHGATTVSSDVLKRRKTSELLSLVAKSTPQNRLYLNQCSESNLDYFADAYDWFEEVLVVIFPTTYHSLVPLASFSEKEFGNLLVTQLERLGTGVSGFDLKEIPVDSGEIPKDLLENLGHGLQEGEVNSFQTPVEKKRYFIKKERDRLHIYKLMLCHMPAGCDYQVDFETSEESDGTNRLLDLLPILFSEEKVFRHVYVIDEFDRSLHANLIQDFLWMFTKSTKTSQMIATTHESALLDLDLVRRDEIWFVEKDNRGASNLYSLEEFAPRYDKDIRKGYMLGRFGAIPMISKPNFDEE